MDLLRFLNDQVLREQEIFWQRFYAFTTLHAGAFVLVSSDAVRAKKALAIAGFILTLIWIWVQSLSLGYADRAKRLYHDFRKWLEIYFDYENAPSDPPRAGLKVWLRTNRRLSSTNQGRTVTILVALIWLAYLIVAPWWAK